MKDGWIEPQEDANHNQIYYFANDVQGMNWYDADDYCHNKGGFLAEPLTAQENDFLKGYASSLGKSNWWIGKVPFRTFGYLGIWIFLDNLTYTNALD